MATLGSALALGVVGCAISAGEDTSSFRDVGQAVGTPGMGANDMWRNWSNELTDAEVISTPAVCSNHWSPYLVVKQNADQRYYVRMHGYIPPPNWKQFGFRQFVSAPSCVYQQPMTDISDKPDDHRFLLTGKSTDNRIYIIEGLSSEEVVQPDPSDPGTLQWNNPNWSAPVASPNLPSGATPDGVPAITHMGAPTNRFVIMQRGVLGGTSSLYWTYFDGSSFVGAWHALPVTTPVGSDPALEWEGSHGMITVYFKTDVNKITQT